MSRTIYTEVDLGDFDDEDLIEELNERGCRTFAEADRRLALQEKMVLALYRGEPLEGLVRQYLHDEGYCV